MSDGRLAAKLEASSFIRRAEVAGGSGMVVARGDPERGALILLFAQRGTHVACMERQLGPSGCYEWRKSGPEAGASEAELRSWLKKRREFDPDSWLIELDVPLTERFIAETTSTG